MEAPQKGKQPGEAPPDDGAQKGRDMTMGLFRRSHARHARHAAKSSRAERRAAERGTPAEPKHAQAEQQVHDAAGETRSPVNPSASQ
jgi:hypothetical protein